MKKVYLIAVIFAIIAGVATYMFATEIDKKTTFKDADMVTVLIPTADIDKNVEITADMFEGDNPQIITKEILAADSNESYIKAQKELVDDANNVHMITVDKLYANEPINKNRLQDKNGDDVALGVTVDLKLDFLPTGDTFFYQDLGDWGQTQTVSCDLSEFFFIVSATTAGTTQGKSRTEDNWNIALVDACKTIFNGD